MQKASKRFVLLVELASWSPSSAVEGRGRQDQRGLLEFRGPITCQSFLGLKGPSVPGNRRVIFACHVAKRARTECPSLGTRCATMSRFHATIRPEERSTSAPFLETTYENDSKPILRYPPVSSLRVILYTMWSVDWKETMRWKLCRDCLEFQFFFLIENICWNRKIEWRLCYCIMRIERKIVEIYWFF